MERAFLEFMAEVLSVPVERLSLDTAYGVLPEWDSVMHLRLVLEIGARYGVEIPVDEIAAIRTLRDFYAHVSGVSAQSACGNGK